jgi:prepilin-type N-terminal cleavage/methylation domain-containing protein
VIVLLFSKRPFRNDIVKRQDKKRDKKNMPSTKHHTSGFTLIEIAVVLVVLSILLAAVAIPIATQLNQRRATETQRTLDIANQALIGFASVSGRLPCPATDGGSVGIANSFGVEAFAAGGTEANGNCAVWVGYVPAVTLGLSPVDSQGFLVDGWGTKANRIRYSVWGGSLTAAGFSATNVFTKIDGIKNTPPADLMNTSINFRLLFICQSAPLGTPLPSATQAPTTSNICGSGVVTLADRAPAVVYSLGANAATGGTSLHELHNVNQDFVFVAHEQTTAGTLNGEFDDIITWMSLPLLISRMQQGGRL